MSKYYCAQVDEIFRLVDIILSASKWGFSFQEWLNLVVPLTTHLSLSLSHDQIYCKYNKYWTEEDKNQVH